jgi:hypothetical protein
MKKTIDDYLKLLAKKASQLNRLVKRAEEALQVCDAEGDYVNGSRNELEHLRKRLYSDNISQKERKRLEGAIAGNEQLYELSSYEYTKASSTLYHVLKKIDTVQRDIVRIPIIN